jgi:hypothetical protein
MRGSVMMKPWPAGVYRGSRFEFDPKLSVQSNFSSRFKQIQLR